MLSLNNALIGTRRAALACRTNGGRVWTPYASLESGSRGRVCRIIIARSMSPDAMSRRASSERAIASSISARSAEAGGFST